jgi:hypothetical protein
MPTLPTAAPATDPRPPTMTTTSANRRMSVSAPGLIVSSPAAIIPATPARTDPTRNIAAKTRSTSMPRAPTISRSSTPARSIAPTRVRWWMSWSRTPTAIAKAITNSR